MILPGFLVAVEVPSIGNVVAACLRNIGLIANQNPSALPDVLEFARRLSKFFNQPRLCVRGEWSTTSELQIVVNDYVNFMDSKHEEHKDMYDTTAHVISLVMM